MRQLLKVKNQTHVYIEKQKFDLWEKCNLSQKAMRDENLLKKLTIPINRHYQIKVEQTLSS